MSATQADVKNPATAAPNVDETSTTAEETGSSNVQVTKRLIHYMVGKGNEKRFWIALIVSIVGLIALMVIPLFTGEAINVVSDPNGSLSMLRLWAGLAILAAAIYLGLSVWTSRVFADLASHATNYLQTDLFEHIQTLSLTFFDRQPVGELMSRVTNDTEVIALFYETAVAQMIQAVVQLVLIITVMFVLDWRITIAALLVLPLMFFLSAIIERISTPAFAKLQEDLGELSGFQEETLSGHKVIIGNRRQDWADETNEAYAKGVFNVASKAFFTSILQFPVTSTVVSLMMVIVLLVGGVLVLAGEISIGFVIAFLGYAALLASPISTLANLTSTILNALAGGRRVFSIMDEEPTVVDAPDAKDFEFKGGHVVFEDVDFSYVPGRKILRHNTFEAEPGEKIGICGPTGAGKSTIINILTRYYDVDSGKITIDDQDLTTLTQRSLRQQIGVVLQEAFLFSDTVMNNLKYAREGATDEECIEAAKEANAHEFIMNLPQGYDTMLTERGANLSQGQRQMITIARAMVAQPKMMILDEATSNVDTRTEKLIQGGLTRLMEGKTSFSIAHRLSTIQDSAKIMVLNAGEIVEYASHNELMAAKGFYYNLYMSQFKGKGPGGEVDTSGFVST